MQGHDWNQVVWQILDDLPAIQRQKDLFANEFLQREGTAVEWLKFKLAIHQYKIIYFQVSFYDNHLLFETQGNAHRVLSFFISFHKNRLVQKVGQREIDWPQIIQLVYVVEMDQNLDPQLLTQHFNHYNTSCNFNLSGGQVGEGYIIIQICQWQTGCCVQCRSITSILVLLLIYDCQQNTDVADTMLFNYFCLYGRYVTYVSLIMFPSLVFFLAKPDLQDLKKTYF